MQFTGIACVRDQQFERYEYEESTVIIQASVIARDDVEDLGFVDGAMYNIEVLNHDVPYCFQ